MTDDALEVYLRCDWGEDTALWTEDYPIDMDALHFTPPLLIDLHSWTHTFVHNTVSQGSFVWKDGFDVARFDDNASNLAERIALEVGSEFCVTYELTGSSKAEVHRTDKAPTNNAAAVELKHWILSSTDE